MLASYHPHSVRPSYPELKGTFSGHPPRGSRLLENACVEARLCVFLRVAAFRADFLRLSYILGGATGRAFLRPMADCSSGFLAAKLEPSYAPSAGSRVSVSAYSLMETLFLPG